MITYKKLFLQVLLLVVLPVFVAALSIISIGTVSDLEFNFIYYGCLSLAVLLAVQYHTFDSIQRITSKDLIIVVIGFLTIYGIDKLIVLIFGSFYSESFERPAFSTYWDFAFIVVFAPILEEIIFRGFLYQNAKQLMNKVTAMTVTSALWTALHYSPEVNWTYYMAIMLSGMFFCKLYDLKSGLYLAILVHGLLNFKFFYAYASFSS